MTNPRSGGPEPDFDIGKMPDEQAPSTTLPQSGIEDGTLVVPGSPEDKTIYEDPSKGKSTFGDLDEHRSSAELDHPINSVKLKHLDNNVRSILENFQFNNDSILEIATATTFRSAVVMDSTLDVAGDLTVTSDIYLENNAIIASYTDSSNVDHIWHDDGNNAWNFVSDSTYKAEGNSRLVAGSMFLTTEMNGVLQLARGSGNASIKPISGESWLIADGNTNLGLNYYANGKVIIATGGGNVGINTTSPSDKLEVNGYIRAGTSGRGVKLSRDSAGYPTVTNWGGSHLMLDSIGGGNVYVNWSVDGGFYVGGGGDVTVELSDASGYVGIHRNRSPSYQLDVGGETLVRGVCRSTNTLRVNNTGPGHYPGYFSYGENKSGKWEPNCKNSNGTAVNLWASSGWY